MIRTIVKVLIPVLALAVGACGGYYAGLYMQMDRHFASLQAETAGNLSLRVDVLSHLRAGDVPAAIKDEEMSVDAAIRSLPLGKPWKDLRSNVQKALQWGRLYRTAYPPEAPVDSLLAQVLAETPLLPTLEMKPCNPALQRMAEEAHKKAASQESK